MSKCFARYLQDRQILFKPLRFDKSRFCANVFFLLTKILSCHPTINQKNYVNLWELKLVVACSRSYFYLPSNNLKTFSSWLRIRSIYQLVFHNQQPSVDALINRFIGNQNDNASIYNLPKYFDNLVLLHYRSRLSCPWGASTANPFSGSSVALSGNPFQRAASKTSWMTLAS